MDHLQCGVQVNSDPKSALGTLAYTAPEVSTVAAVSPALPSPMLPSLTHQECNRACTCAVVRPYQL